MKKTSLHTGSLGESIACRYLQKKGYTLCTQNYTNHSGYRLGEIDIVAYKDDQWVFVEVKTVRVTPGGVYEDLEERITAEKLRKLERIAEEYLRSHNLKEVEYRFDALFVWFDPMKKQARVRHIEHIFL